MQTLRCKRHFLRPQQRFLPHGTALSAESEAVMHAKFISFRCIGGRGVPVSKLQLSRGPNIT